jgi:hypothetical protein
VKRLWQRTGTSDPPVGESDVVLPDPPTEVRLAMPDGDRLPARVARRDGDQLLILMMVPADPPLSDDQLREIVLELDGHRGLTRLAGNAALEERDVLRFRDLYSLELLQRRNDVRVKSTRTVLVSLSGSLAPVEASTVDLSGGGMLLSGLEHLRVGSRLDFRLTTSPDSHPITGSGIVVRSDASGRRAIAFQTISDGNRRRLVRFLFDCQRQERSRGLLGDDHDGR